MGAEDVADGGLGGEVVAVERDERRRFRRSEGWHDFLAFADCFLRVLAAAEEEQKKLVEGLVGEIAVGCHLSHKVFDVLLVAEFEQKLAEERGRAIGKGQGIFIGDARHV